MSCTNLNTSRKVKKRGTEIILDVLRERGTEYIFGYPGGCVIPLFDELLNYPELKMVLVRHEQAATHAADGQARVTGKAGVAIVTSGPGATNTITGLATAIMDSIPMVVISGQDISRLRQTLREAFYIAETGKPGPVLVDIPVDLQRQVYEFEPDNDPINIPGYTPTSEPADSDVRAAWELIKESKRPLLYIGGGVIISNAAKELKEFAELSGIPVSTTLLGQGAYAEDNPLALGMLGMHGTYAANKAMMETDMAIAVGARFDDRVTSKLDEFLVGAKIIHVDIDAACIGKNKVPDIGIVSDARAFLSAIIKIAHPLPDIADWVKEVTDNKKNVPPPNYDDVKTERGQIRPEYAVRVLSKKTDGKAVVVTDVGQHQMFVCLHYNFKYPRSEITSGGLGTMGFSLPAAMGIAMIVHDRPVISVSGDGGFQMNMQELATIRTYNIPVKMVIFNNRNLGMVKQWQDFFWQSRYSSVIFDQNPDFVRLCGAFDIPAACANEKEELPDMVETMLNTPGPYLLEIKIDENAHVFPMIPSDRFGALSRIIELFASRGYNLDSICSGSCEIPDTQRLTLVTKEDTDKIEKIVKILNGFIDVVEAHVVDPALSHSREMMLMNLEFKSEHRTEIISLIQGNKGEIVEMTPTHISFEVNGSANQLDKLTELFREFNITEMARTGEAAIHR
ncbi:hypothetical protein CHS0354_013143 [Potamilus streckersoni]|uniref:acetolactate synthase n=1 Tax=Potamilus streckersoni TaxID=2493646 RepID=A0AAE0S718_9BIVA|nr:hypothetical protein CHS0354_013143 [Potamilus streckersoni]